MFICKICGRQVGPRERMHKVVTKRRRKVYSEGIQGWEIVREVPACVECAEAHRENSADEIDE